MSAAQLRPRPSAGPAASRSASIRPSPALAGSAREASAPDWSTIALRRSGRGPRIPQWRLQKCPP